MKITSFYLTLFLCLSSSIAHADSVVNRKVLLVGCNNQVDDNADKICWINLNTAVTRPIDCDGKNSFKQFRWQQTSALTGQNNADEIFTMAMVAQNTGQQVRLSLDDTECYGGTPLIKWMSTF